MRLRIDELHLSRVKRPGGTTEWDHVRILLSDLEINEDFCQSSSSVSSNSHNDDVNLSCCDMVYRVQDLE